MAMKRALAAEGSSPLARGLPVRAALVRRREGIIPARAGFTVRVSDDDSMRTDHPRSRGVYTVNIYCNIIIAGSSPLARGLHQG